MIGFGQFNILVRFELLKNGYIPTKSLTDSVMNVFICELKVMSKYENFVKETFLLNYYITHQHFYISMPVSGIFLLSFSK